MTEARATGAIALRAYGPSRLDERPVLLLDRRLRGLPSPASLELLRQSAQRRLRHIDRYPGLYLPRAAGAVLAALIAYQCVTLFNVMVMPLEGRPDRAAPSSELRPATRLGSFDPFFTAPSAAVAPIVAADLTLHGLRQDRRTGGGSAIISQSAGAQRSFGVGEDIASGIVLKQVGFDHVIIVRNGMDERLAFQEFASAGPAPRAAAPPAPPAQRPSQSTQVASSAPEVRPGRRESRAPALPARSINFADPSTLPASLTSGPALRNRR